MPQNKFRFFIIKAVMAIMLIAIVARLFNLQIINGERYREQASSRLTTSIVSKAPRGDILDRYGKILVSNKTGYSAVIQYTGADYHEMNDTFSRVIDILISTGNPVNDSLPISLKAPYEFVFEDKNGDGSSEDERAEWFERKIKWFKDKKYEGEINSGMTAADLLFALKDIYKIDGDLYDEHTRRVIGLRYEATEKQFSQVNPLVAAEDINVEAVTRLKEEQNALHGVTVAEDYVRTYNYPGFATHILGRTGKISAEEYEKKSGQGYGMNDTIGKEGVERWAEEYLRGTEGIAGAKTNVDGEEVSLTEDVDPVPGDYVMLTIDYDLQTTLEKSLADTVKAIGNDCNAGAAVVLDVNSGDCLAMGSYPTYDMSRYMEDYNKLLEDKNNPMYNRAVAGLYSPGSTFKPLTAIAGLQSGVVSLNETITCTGVYRFYQDYQPTCWIWNEARLTHGPQNVTMAIENSCNVFFYELGRRLGIDRLDEYAKKFGLGQYTGIQLPEEAEGAMASPEFKKKMVQNVVDSEWFGGDTLQAAIGQSYSVFTPVQLASYCSTIANGGTRYKVNLIDSIRSSIDGSIIEDFAPTIEENIDINSATLKSIHEGMKKVVDEGSARSIFADYPIQVGGKTGTAQLGKGSNNAIFIAFAPFEKPEIAIAVVLEHGVRGTNAGRVAKDVFDKYFLDNADNTTQTPPAMQGEIR